MMQVRAVRMGFYEALRQPGDVFAVEDGLTASWFVPVEEQAEPQASGEPTAEELRAKLDALGIKYPARAGKDKLAALLAEHEAG